jgi:hypothetical protein
LKERDSQHQAEIFPVCVRDHERDCDSVVTFKELGLGFFSHSGLRREAGTDADLEIPEPRGCDSVHGGGDRLSNAKTLDCTDSWRCESLWETTR